MPTLTIIDRRGERRTLEVGEGFTVMQVARESGFGDILALCGGCCSCATCHVYVDEAFSASLPPMSGDEDDLLDSSQYRRANSRLGCQLPLVARLSGLTVTVAPED